MARGYYVGRGEGPAGLFDDADVARQRGFFASRPELAPTPLTALPSLASRLRLGGLFIKDETSRFGLNAFKTAGATFAVATLLARGEIQRGDTLVCASEGNHGRAVARAARDAGCQARVYMAHSVAPSRVEAIQDEGARIVLVAGTYDDAVRQMAAEAASNGWLVISDTGWPGYDEIPRLIMLGYTRLMDEAEAAWSPGPPPDAIFVPAGVGGLLAAVASWAHWRFGDARPRVIGVEPESAACVQEAVKHGPQATLAGPFDTVMGGLRCGEISHTAYDALRTLVDGYVAIEDEWSFEAIRRLAAPDGTDPAIRAGASGAAALGGVMATLFDASLDAFHRATGLGPSSRVLAVATEGVTDPAVFAEAMAGRSTLGPAR